MHIRIISPSGAIDPVYIEDSTSRLRAWGYKVSEGAYARARRGRFAGSDDERLSDICEALSDRSVDMILCSRGGYGLQRIIDRVPPITKPIIGFSDITALHQLSAMRHQPSVHGIMCKHIASLSEESEAIRSLRRILSGEGLYYRWEGHPLNRPGEASGPIIGGNLSVLYGLQGTPYGLVPALSGYSSEKPILLIEDISERHYHIDRMMRNLRMSGALASLGGVIAGQFSECDEDPLMCSTVYETIYEAVADYGYPVVFNAPVGHVSHNLPLVLGKRVHLTVAPEAVSVSIPSLLP